MIQKNVLYLSIFVFLSLSCILYRTVPNANAHYEIDSWGYDRIAQNFYEHTVLTDPLSPENPPVQTVGYPFILGLLYKLFDHSIWAIIWLQILITIFSLLLLYRISLLLFDENIANITLFLGAINIGFLTYAQFLLTETLFIFLALFSLERFITYLQRRKIKDLIFSGVVAGLSIIIKPLLLGYVPFFVLVFPFFITGSIGQKVRSALLFFLCCYMPVAGYMARNKVVYDHFALAPMTPLNFYHVLLARVIAYDEGVSFEEAKKQLPPFTGTTRFDYVGWDDAKKMFFSYLKNHPTTFIAVIVRNMIKTMFGLFSTQMKVLFGSLQGGQSPFFAQAGSLIQRVHMYLAIGTDGAWFLFFVALCEALWTVIRLLFLFVGFASLFARSRYILLLFFTSFIGYVVVVSAFDGCARYRMPIEPLLLMVTAFGMYQLCAWLKSYSVTLKGDNNESLCSQTRL